MLEPLETRLLLSAGNPTIELFSASSALFVANQGQWPDASIRYGFSGDGVAIAFTDAGLDFNLWRRDPALPERTAGDPAGALRESAGLPRETAQFSVSFPGAHVVTPAGQQRAATQFNYFVGEAAQWRSGVPGYQSVVYPGLYDGVDLHTFGRRSSLKYEFHVAPGADYRPITVRYDGVAGLSLDDSGRLHVQTVLGELVDEAPYVYQVIAGQEVAVPSRFELTADGAYRFVLTGSYDRTRELVLDPDLAWATYLGGSSGEYSYGIAIDSAGNALVTGVTYSTDFAGRTNDYYGGTADAFVAKVTSTGSLLWSTYLGGSEDEACSGIALDSDGNALVTGNTFSPDFAGKTNSYYGDSDVFVAKVTSTGSLLWSTYLGGSGTDDEFDIALDSAGNAWATGMTESTDFAGATNSYFGGLCDIYVAKVTSTGNVLWSTYVGGSGTDEGCGIALDSAGNALITGPTFSTNLAGRTNSYFGGDWDGFVAKVTSTGSLLWSTYLGGSGREYSQGIALDSAGNAWVTGLTDSTNLVGRTNSYYGGSWDGFVAKVTSTGSLLWSTYLGGSGKDNGIGIALDSAGNALIAGYTASTNFAGATNSYSGGTFDAFLAKVTSAGSLRWVTYLGGSGEDEGYGIALDSAGNAWVTGATGSTNFAGRTNSYNGGYFDAFVARVNIQVLATPAAPQLDLASDTGVPGDRVTSTLRPRIIGSVLPLVTVQIFDGAANLGCTTAAADGTYQFTPAANLVPGLHSLSIYLANALDDCSAFSSPLLVLVIDPTKRTVVLPPASAGGSLILKPEASATQLYLNTPSTGTPTLTIPIAEFDHLDVGDRLVPITGSTLADVTGWILSGWLLSSQTTGTPPATSLGALQGSDFAALHPGELVGGSPVDPATVLVCSTYRGDSNLDHRIDFNDYLAIDSGYLFGGSTWARGDFNYSGTVTPADYALIDATYQAQLGALAAPLIQAHTAWFGESYLAALIPAPSGASPEDPVLPEPLPPPATPPARVLPVLPTSAAGRYLPSALSPAPSVRYIPFARPSVDPWASIELARPFTLPAAARLGMRDTADPGGFLPRSWTTPATPSSEPEDLTPTDSLAGLVPPKRLRARTPGRNLAP